ncbi:MAG TPA: hypothetical protein VGP79_02115 [Bryobacteraceae bacterium]|jgi:hypothetical protein|nr:hypothetical protein [Bryobacteraceae bacterium]
MSAITLHIPDDLAERLRGREEQLAEILELGLREMNAGAGFEGTSDVLELLASLPAPETILALRPSERLERRIEELVEKSRAAGLTAPEEAEWERYEYLEHLVRMAKANAQQKAGSSSGSA